MVRLHMTEAELARDLHGAIEKVLQGSEIVIQQGTRAIAVLKRFPGPRRSIDECIAVARARQSAATLDEDFARQTLMK